MTVVCERTGSPHGLGAPITSAAISPVLTPLLQRLNDTMCTHVDAGILCTTCADELSALKQSATGTETSTLPEADLRKLLIDISSFEEREMCELIPHISLGAFCIASMKINDDVSVIRSGPIDDAVAAAASVCVTTYETYASSTPFLGGLHAADRAVNVFRVRARSLVSDRTRRSDTDCRP